MGNTHRKNTIIVGAGASKEFNLPTGEELKTQISSMLDIRYDTFGQHLIAGDRVIANTIQYLCRELSGNMNYNAALGEAWKIRDNMPLAPSIDNFLDTHRDNELLVKVGKIAIARAISLAEVNSKLAIKTDSVFQKFDINLVNKTWLGKFFTILVAQRDFSEFLKALNNITFVSFNYDRCIEHFFYIAALQYFSLTSSDLAQLKKALYIIHPYGSISPYEFQNKRSTNFGQQLTDHLLLASSKRINTFTEGSSSNKADDIRKHLLESDIVMFLGFGFHQINMELLFQETTEDILSGFSGLKNANILATGYGLSENSRGQIHSKLSKIFHEKSNIEIIDKTCSDFFHEYERLLSH